jgi:hypothetical protein
MRRTLNTFAIGIGVGYVLGTRAGREQYDLMVSWWNRATGHPMVERAGRQGRELIGQGVQWVEDRAQKVPVGRSLLGVVHPESVPEGSSPRSGRSLSA